MKVVQAVFGAFHHFDLARELDRRGHLQTIYSTWPWARLQREGLPREKVRTFPWIHTATFLLERYGVLPHWLGEEMGVWTALTFDEFTNSQVRSCDAFIALAGAGLKTGSRLQKDGTIFLCDRGSSHQRWQEKIVSQEYRRWKVDLPVSDLRDTLREEAIYEACDGITVPSHFAQRTFLELGVPAAKVHVIPYGVRLERFQPVAQPSSDAFEVLFAGGVSLRKGVPYLLEAFARLNHPRKRLRFCGDVPAWMKPVIARLPTAQVEFLGVQPQDRMPEIMSRSHVMVLPSIEEGLALVQGQAMACGCPILATRNTGSEDLFTDGVEGFIVPIRDVDALTQRLQQLADDRTLQQRMSASALTRVKHLGGWSTYGDQWEALLHRLTGKD